MPSPPAHTNTPKEHIQEQLHTLLSFLNHRREHASKLSKKASGGLSDCRCPHATASLSDIPLEHGLIARSLSSGLKQLFNARPATIEGEVVFSYIEELIGYTCAKLKNGTITTEDDFDCLIEISNFVANGQYPQADEKARMLAYRYRGEDSWGFKWVLGLQLLVEFSVKWNASEVWTKAVVAAEQAQERQQRYQEQRMMAEIQAQGAAAQANADYYGYVNQNPDGAVDAAAVQGAYAGLPQAPYQDGQYQWNGYGGYQSGAEYLQAAELDAQNEYEENYDPKRSDTGKSIRGN